MTFAQETLDVWGLTTWTLRWDRAKRRAGACDHARNQIRLSKPLFDVFPEDAQRNVILHEVAHALVGPQHKHDRRWKQAAIMLGAQPRALLPSSLPEPECSWVGRCQRFGAERRQHFAPPRGTPPPQRPWGAPRAGGDAPGRGSCVWRGPWCSPRERG